MELPKLDYFHFYYLASNIGITYFRYLLIWVFMALTLCKICPCESLWTKSWDDFVLWGCGSELLNGHSFPRGYEIWLPWSAQWSNAYHEVLLIFYLLLRTEALKYFSEIVPLRHWVQISEGKVFAPNFKSFRSQASQTSDFFLLRVAIQRGAFEIL